MRILVTGGLGYIGSHTIVELLNCGHSVTSMDNLTNSCAEVEGRIRGICGGKSSNLNVIQGDVCDKDFVRKILRSGDVEGVIHFAGLKAVGESVQKPLEYYKNNTQGSICLLEAMRQEGVFKIVISSSATVYGDPDNLPLSETDPTKEPANPYGKTKLMVEKILADVSKSDQRWSIAILRYFNPAGAHSGGEIGEDPVGPPNNLVPFISQVAVGRLGKLKIFGNDYDTKDGTGVRDYIHVVDLARGHLKALEVMGKGFGVNVWNLGTGIGHSVLEVLGEFERVAGRAIPFEVVERRSGDVAACWADPSKAKKELNWKAEKGLKQMVGDAWNWQKKNPSGYTGEME